MNSPEYANSSTYQVLGSFCRMIGVQIKYQGARAAIANVDDVGCPSITMPTESKGFDNMSRVLGHEIAHLLIEDQFVDSGGRASHLIEYCCDQIGNGLFLLAEKIVSEAEGYGEDIGAFMAGAMNGLAVQDDTPAKE